MLLTLQVLRSAVLAPSGAHDIRAALASSDAVTSQFWIAFSIHIRNIKQKVHVPRSRVGDALQIAGLSSLAVPTQDSFARQF
jgi:hypothetical protein